MRKIKLQESKRSEIKYLGEGKVGVYKKGKLVERYQLERGDNLLESLQILEGSSTRKYGNGSAISLENSIDILSSGPSTLVLADDGGDKYIPEFLDMVVKTYNQFEYGVSIPVVSLKGGDYYSISNSLEDDLKKLRDIPEVDDLIKIAKKYSDTYYEIVK